MLLIVTPLPLRFHFAATYKILLRLRYYARYGGIAEIYAAAAAIAPLR